MLFNNPVGVVDYSKTLTTSAVSTFINAAALFTIQTNMSHAIGEDNICASHENTTSQIRAFAMHYADQTIPHFVEHGLPTQKWPTNAKQCQNTACHLSPPYSP